MVAKAWSRSMLLFVGLGPENQLLDVIDRSMATSLRRVGLAVHLPAFDERTRGYIERRYNRMDVSVYWGTTDQFTAELDARLAG